MHDDRSFSHRSNCITRPVLEGRVEKGHLEKEQVTVTKIEEKKKKKRERAHGGEKNIA